MIERNLTHIALFAALIAALGVVPQITLAFGVPVTAQTMGVMLAGAVLGAKRGAAATLLVIGLVALGLPLLSGGRGGLGVFVGPTVGFLVGWLPAAYVTGLFVEHIRLPWTGLTAGIGAALGGILVLYPLGALGMSLVLGQPFLQAMKLVTVFVPGDLLKAAITGMLVAALARARPQSIPWAARAGSAKPTRL